MEKSILTILGILLLGFTSQELFAQTNFMPGYVVTAENDTTYGWIDYRNWGKNPTSITFKEDSAASGKKYGPSQIDFFQVAGDRYLSREVSIDKTPDDVEKLVSSPKTEKDKVFLLAFINGKASLYYYKDKRPHFYVVKDSTTSELISRRLLKYQDGKKIVFKQELYKTQLSILFRDCPEIHADIDKLPYRENNMISIFQDYNKCMGLPSIYVKEKIKPEVEFRLISGLSVTQPALNRPHGNFGKYDRSFNPILGLSFNIVFPRNRARWSMYNELIYTAHYSEEYGTSSKLGGSYLKMSNMIRYRLPGLFNRSFINAGLSNSIAVNIKQSENVSELQSKIKRKYLRGYVFGLGTYFQKLSVEIRYDLGSSVTPAFVYSFRIASVTIGYRFN